MEGLRRPARTQSVIGLSASLTRVREAGLPGKFHANAFCYCMANRFWQNRRMPWRFHIKNYRGRFSILIGLRMFDNYGGLRPEDYIPFSKSAFAKVCAMPEEYEFEAQAQNDLTDIKELLSQRERNCAARRISLQK